MKTLVNNPHDGWSCIEHDDENELKFSFYSHCTKCGSALELGKKYITWYTGGVWCDICGPEILKEQLDIEQKIYDMIDKY